MPADQGSVLVWFFVRLGHLLFLLVDERMTLRERRDPTGASRSPGR